MSSSVGRWRVVILVAAVAAAAVWQPVATAQSGSFDDVPENAYYATPVADLAAEGVFTGTGCVAGFCPGDAIDRKTMAVWTVRILDGEDPPAVAESRFSDVDAGSFHAPFIERMAELGVTTGCGDGTGFCPDRTVTRAQMAVFLSRAYSLPEGPDPGFSDVPSDAWYVSEVAKLAASGITVGCGDGSMFCPGRDTTRAQMATFLWRAENPEWRDSPTPEPEPTEPEPDATPEPEPGQEPEPSSRVAAVLALLDALSVAAEQPSGYDRDLFKHWTDEDGDGCDTRREVLLAEAVMAPTQASRCSLSDGEWISRYDGLTEQGSGTWF